MFQKAMSYGYDGKYDKKAWVLKSLISERPDSKFEIEAKYELARTYLTQERLNDAKTYYNDIINNHSASSYVKYALRDMCLVHIKEGNNDLAKANWVTLKKNYSNDPVLQDAYQICRLALIEDPEFQVDRDRRSHQRRGGDFSVSQCRFVCAKRGLQYRHHQTHGVLTEVQCVCLRCALVLGELLL
jgi:tetratricopeptide (TPR) repeat protein